MKAKTMENIQDKLDLFAFLVFISSVMNVVLWAYIYITNVNNSIRFSDIERRLNRSKNQPEAPKPQEITR